MTEQREGAVGVRDLLLVVPSRERPANIARLAEALEETCRGDTHLLVGLDADDPTLPQYLELDCEAEFVVEPDLHGVVAWVNHLAVPHTGGYRFIGTVNDDNVPRTEGWDLRVIEALGRAPFCFGNDLHPGRPPGSLCCHVFMRAEVVRTLGYMGLPSLRHMYIDDAWMVWGQAVGIGFLPDVVIEHLHPSAGKSEMDANYETSEALMAADGERFDAYRGDGLEVDLAKLRAANLYHDA
ncbi:MAG: hypothetical protein ABSG95_01875 [Solirubrobacteraceae bacterium]|jgi:hypothetical protein